MTEKVANDKMLSNEPVFVDKGKKIIEKFKLFLEYNPSTIYTDVYQTITPNICYSENASEYFDLLNYTLSSSHVPAYIISAYVKKLSRVLLYAPVNCQLPILTIIKNILHRHSAVHEILLNRKENQTLDKDPYDENEPDLTKCKAIDSSLWELTIFQHHWCNKVAKKYNFFNKNMQEDEVLVQWKTSDEMFDQILKKTIMNIQKKNVPLSENV